MDQKLFQIIDANLNRAREGLRVCEDIVRFAIGNKAIAKSLKLVRHSVTDTALRSKKVPLKKLVEARDTEKDTLRAVDLKRLKTADTMDIFMSNIQRTKESLRVLEECCKPVDEDTSRGYRRLRFRVYDIERKLTLVSDKCHDTVRAR